MNKCKCKLPGFAFIPAPSMKSHSRFYELYIISVQPVPPDT